MLPDEPLLSIPRLLHALRLWAWFIAVPDPPIYIPLRRMLAFDRRPLACQEAEDRGSWWAGH